MRRPAWSERDTRLYAERRCNAIELDLGPKVVINDLEFLTSVPELRGVMIAGQVPDPRVLADLTQLECVSLVFASSTVLDLGGLSQLRTATIGRCVDAASLAGAEGLENLMLWGYRGSDLRFAEHLRRLLLVRIEGNRQAIDLDGISSPHLLVLWVHRATTPSLHPLRGMSQLRYLEIGDGKGAHPPLDLSDLSSATQLTWLRILGDRAVASLQPVENFRSLHGLFVGDVVDGDLSPLLRLPPVASIGPMVDRPHYQPSLQSVMVARRGATGV